MKKQLTGKVLSTSMQGTIVVEVTRRVAHPLYKKLMKRSKKFKAATNGQTVTVGDLVTIEETRQIAKGKFFALVGKDKK